MTIGDDTCGLAEAGAVGKVASEYFYTCEARLAVCGRRLPERANAHKAWVKAVDGQYCGAPYHAPAMNA